MRRRPFKKKKKKEYKQNLLQESMKVPEIYQQFVSPLV